MITSESIKDKLYGSNLTTSDLETLTRLQGSFEREHNSLILHGSEVDHIHFEGHGTSFVLAVLEIINPHLQSFKLRLTIEEPLSIRDPLMKLFES